MTNTAKRITLTLSSYRQGESSFPSPTRAQAHNKSYELLCFFFFAYYLIEQRCHTAVTRESNGKLSSFFVSWLVAASIRTDATLEMYVCLCVWVCTRNKYGKNSLR
jgi:hypothetical protein